VSIGIIIIMPVYLYILSNVISDLILEGVMDEASLLPVVTAGEIMDLSI
jgi:hypothetical protein